MIKKLTVIDPTGNHEENLVQWAKSLGRNKLRRKLFNAVYGRNKKLMSKKQIMKIAGVKDSQQAQNELNHLQSYGLIVAQENDGTIKDRSQILYGKDQNVRKCRKRIAALADNPSRAASIPTKRRPQGTMTVKKSGAGVNKRALRKKKPLNVLYLTASPATELRLRVDEEVKQVQKAIRGSVYRDNISVEHRPAADFDSLLDGLNDFRPRIVHFSGHGNGDGLAIEGSGRKKGQGQSISFDFLAETFSSCDDPPDVLVLNACNSSGAKRKFFPTVKALVVMKKSIDDADAITFAKRFYAAIASGESIKSSVCQGKLAVEYSTLNNGGDTPELLWADGINPAKMILA
jgi:hypothetical protein